jgi:2-polyprenyl-3-methyl-5-hydroxy-6-metoxy-1,4-benzoquinol methylase
MKDRFLIPELMDDPNLDPHEHQKALAGLRRINLFCGTGRILANHIQAVADRSGWRQISVLDLGCGSGDIAIELALRLQSNLDVTVTGWDMSATAIETANERMLAHRLRPVLSRRLSEIVNFEQRNALETIATFRSDTVSKKFDIVYCTLFMHHFSEPLSIELLRAMKQLSKGFVVVDDLNRTYLGWVLATVGCHLLSRSKVVHFDGPQSVRAAYTPAELLALAEKAGLNDAEIKRHWPQRFLSSWDVR